MKLVGVFWAKGRDISVSVTGARHTIKIEMNRSERPNLRTASGHIKSEPNQTCP